MFVRVLPFTRCLLRRYSLTGLNEKTAILHEWSFGDIKLASENQARIHGQGSPLISDSVVWPQQDSGTALEGPIVSQRGPWGQLASTPQPPPLSCILSP